jgi:hypothetical protein
MPKQPEEEQARPFCPEDYIERVRRRAYEIYLARGGTDGREFDDWVKAEKEVRKQLGIDR